MSSNRSLLLGLIVLAVSAPGIPAAAGNKITVGRRVTASKRVSMDRVTHGSWDALLKKYVDSRGRVDYRSWKASAADMAALDRYLQALSHADLRRGTSRQGRMAFWINAYNAVTIKGILREYPTTSIRNHTAKVLGYNIWHDLLLIVGDNNVSLNDMEHKILRKAGDARIHFAIVCASHSCPRLLNAAYTGRQLEQQLVTNTREFFANRENFRYADGTFYLSSIMKWFATDFGGNSQAQLRSISRYLPDAGSRQAAASGQGRISYLKYDWSINEQPRVRNARR